MEHRVNVVGGKLFLEVADVTLAGTGAEGFGLKTVKLFAQADVSAVGAAFRVLFLLKPKKKN